MHILVKDIYHMYNKRQVSKSNFLHYILNKNSLFLLVFFCFTVIVKAQVPISSLVAYWPFDGVDLANDLSSNNNNGTIYGATLTIDRFGNCNQAYKFNGLNNYIDVPHSSTIDMNNTDFTIAVWEKTYASDTIGPILQKHIHTGAWEGYLIATNDNDPGYCPLYKHAYFYVAAGANQEVCTDNPICQDTAWHFLTGVYKHSLNQYYLYIDGVLQSSVGTGTGNTSNSASLVFGGGGGAFFTGALDAIRIYKRALSNTEILQLYNEPNPGSSGAIAGFVKDTTVCSTNIINVNAQTAQSYTWSTGATTQSISISNSGTYWVQVQPQIGCKETDTIHANFVTPPIINILKDTTFCSNINYSLNASSVHAVSYHWSNGAVTSSIIPPSSGIYWVDMNINNCTVRDSANVILLNPPVLNIKDTIICKDPLTLSIKDTTLQITWFNGSHSYQTEIITAGTYYVSASKNNCTTTDSIYVRLMNNIEKVVVPNIFTPNNDGRNDVFEFNTNYAEVIEFKIYNRWGLEVYSANNFTVYWDGKQNGDLIDDGIYFWEATFQNSCQSSQSIKQKGFITLLK